MDPSYFLWKLSLVVFSCLDYASVTATSIILVSYTCEIPVWHLQDTANTKYGIILEPNPWKLMKPLDGFFKWKDNDPIYIGCGNETRSFKCNSKTSAEDFVCIKPPKVDFANTKKTCAKTGTQYQIGFTIKKAEFIPYYEVCYNNLDCSVIYSNHQLLGESFNKISKNPRLEGKAFTKFNCSIDYYTLYTQSNQKKNSRINTSKGYLQRGHLFPDRDAPVYSWKLATYSYGNCAPEWETINSNGNWYKLEEMVSDMAIKKSLNFDIYDGVLYKPNLQRKIFLDQGSAKIEVPQWFYKVVINRNKSVVPGLAGRMLEEEMIFFVYNDPYSSPADTFCHKQNQCADYNWIFADDQVRGKTHCCLHGDLKTGTLPDEVMNAFGNTTTGMYYFKRPRTG